jgi:hypothetical protein
VSGPNELENQSIELGDEPRAVLVGTQIEFRRVGHDPVTITLTVNQHRTGTPTPIAYK